MIIKNLLISLAVCQCILVCDSRPKGVSNSFKIIRSFTDKMNITMHGTMKTNTNILVLSLSDKNSKSVCSITYDASAKTATMQSESNDEDAMPYDIEHDPTVPARFLLEIKPRILDQKQLIQLHFEVDSAGPLIFEACKIEDFKKIHRIVVDGAHLVSSILFKLPE